MVNDLDRAREALDAIPADIDREMWAVSAWPPRLLGWNCLTSTPGAAPHLIATTPAPVETPGSQSMVNQWCGRHWCRHPVSHCRRAWVESEWSIPATWPGGDCRPQAPGRGATGA